MIGRDPAVARNLHFGDYVNLSVELDLDLNNIAQIVCIPFSLLPDGTPLDELIDLPGLCAGVVDALQGCLKTAAGPGGVRRAARPTSLDEVCDAVPILRRCCAPASAGAHGGDGQAATSRHGIEDLLDGIIGNLGLPAAGTRPDDRSTRAGTRGSATYNADLALFLAAPVLGQEVDAVITRRTKIQLLVFAIITLLGVSFVGARYAQLDRLIVDQSYIVVAHYPESGGIFAGGEVTYRGVRIGQVSELELTDDGVDVHLEIDNEWDKIPADTRAIVGNRSAVGEQYVELQPNVDVEDSDEFLEDGSEIDEVAIPISTEKLLGDIASTVSSVDRDSLQTTVEELGDAFAGTGEDLQRIIDTGNSFIETANENFDVTTALIRDANVVLQTQFDSSSSLRTFATQLRVFSRAMVGADKDLRKVIDSGSFTANQLRTFLEQNEAELSDLLANVITTGRRGRGEHRRAADPVHRLPDPPRGLVRRRLQEPDDRPLRDPRRPDPRHDDALLPGLRGHRHPRARRTSRTGRPQPQRQVHGAADQEQPARHPEPPAGLPRPRRDPGRQRADHRVLRPETGKFRAGDAATTQDDSLAPSGNVAPPPLGEDSWKWLYLEPLLDAQE